jgi:hypothetical protein
MTRCSFLFPVTTILILAVPEVHSLADMRWLCCEGVALEKPL